MKRILYYFLFFPLLAVAQINESDSLNFKANLSLTGFWQSGNVDTWIFRAKSDVSFKPWGNTVFKTKNSYVYQEFGKEKADEDMLSLNFLYFNPEKKLYPFVLGFVSTNYRREIGTRYLFGAGATYQIMNKKKYWLKFSLSSEYENTNFSSTTYNLSEYNGQSAINTMRGTLWVNGKYHIVEDKIILLHESYYQPSLKESNNFRWRADISLELPIWKFMSFKVNYLHTYESIVIVDQKKKDQQLTFGITLKNY